ncbi:MAG: metallopeptidase family protein [Candidatus Saccharimonas sp.]
MHISDQEFDALITRAMDELPQEYIQNLDNVAITYADNPTPEQLAKQGVRHGHLLLGLYEGIPLTQRGAGYMMVLPDKITLFKNTILQVSRTSDEFYEQIKRTLWHEIAHHYGLGHNRIHKLEDS